MVGSSDGLRQELAAGPDALARYQAARAEWKLLTAAALVGLTERALGIAVEFARTRETMGVPIGSLQGVAFPLADVAIGISGRAEPGLAGRAGCGPRAVASAAASCRPCSPTRPRWQPTAPPRRAHAGRPGFTTEADASLYFLRAKGWSLLAGDPADDVMAIGDALLAGTAARTRGLPTPRQALDERDDEDFSLVPA